MERPKASKKTGSAMNVILDIKRIPNKKMDTGKKVYIRAYLFE